MHVRILAGYLNRDTGSAIYNTNLANSLYARGYRVSVVAFGPSELLQAGITLAALTPRNFAATRLWRIDYPLGIIDYWHRAADMPADRPDLCIAAEHLLILPHARRFASVPWIYLPHSRILEEDLAARFCGFRQWSAIRAGRQLQLWALHHATTTLRFHDASRDTIIKHYGLSATHPFFVNPSGTHPPVEISRPPLQHGKKKFRFLTVGALNKRKNLQLALNALSRFARDPSWHYDIVGAGEERATLEELTGRLGIANRITFHGQQDDTAPYYNAADIFLFPSYADNAPLVIMEAMSWALPIIALDDEVPGTSLCNRSIIHHATNGLLASSCNDFSKLIGLVLSGTCDTRGLGQAAREEILSKFTWDRHVDRLEAKLKDLVKLTSVVKPT